MNKTVFFALMLAFGINTLAKAHSIRFEFEEHAPVVTLWAGFSTASPLVNAKVDVYGPDMKSPYQTGRMDQTGRFAFIPTDVGEWRLLVDDERGHRQNARIQIGTDFFAVAEADAEAETPQMVEQAPAETQTLAATAIPLVYMAIFGLAIIFGMTGIFYGLSARKK